MKCLEIPLYSLLQDFEITRLKGFDIRNSKVKDLTVGECITLALCLGLSDMNELFAKLNGRLS